MIKKKLFIMIAAIMMLPMGSLAQWRAGLNFGGDYNFYTRDVHYLSDVHYEGHEGFTLGASVQYDFLDWLGVRADINIMEKNHLEKRKLVPIDYRIDNSYLQVPVMASFSFGGRKLRGFMNLGFYGGYWMNSRLNGKEYDTQSGTGYEMEMDMSFSDTRDQRWDFGLVAGAGVEYRFATHWAAQMELRHYYSTISTTKDYMRYKDPRYNSTTAFTVGVHYLF